LKLSRSIGLVVVLSSESVREQERLQWEAAATNEGVEFVFDLAKQDLPQDDGEAVAAVVSLLGPLRRSNQ